MGRLIDADEVNDAIYKCFEGIQFYDGTGYDIYSDSKENIDKIPTIEAIPKADYENRLKADMVAILVELQMEVEELKNEPACCHHFVRGIRRSSEVIQQKINELKGDNNEQK